MEPRRIRTYRILAFDLLLTLFCFSNIPSVVDRARLPLTSALEGTRTVVTSVEPHPGVAFLRPGDILLQWNDIPIARPEHVEFLGDRSRIGESVQITVERDETVLTVPASLVAFYASLRFALVHSITGLVVFSLAVFLILKRPQDASASSLHRALLSLGALVLLTQGALDLGDPLSYLRRAGLFFAYALTAALFLEWTLRFPVRWLAEHRWPRTALTASALIFASILSWFHLRAMTDGSPGLFGAFQDAYEVFHLYFPVLIVSGLIVLGAGYVIESDPDRRTALRWVLWGMIAGTLPFTLLVVLPQGFGPEFLVPEEIGTVFALAIPVSLTVAFLRYHVFDVQVEMHRQFASRVLTIVTGSLSVLVSLVIVSLVWEDLVFDEHFAPALAIALTMLLLQPARTFLRRVIEESLHPVRGALAQALHRAEVRFQEAMTPDQLGTVCLQELATAMPGIGFEWMRVHSDGQWMVRHQESDTVIANVPPTVRSALRPRAVIARPDSIRRLGPSDEPSLLEWLSGRSAELAIGLHDEAGSLLGIVTARRSSRREPLFTEELQAMRALITQASGSLSRLQLQERVFIAQQERRRSDELSRQKSRFVSSVSHDLRTPLTSITMFAEMMQRHQLSEAQRREYAEIIERESRRLGRMVNNVLNFARIERGAREYTLRPIDLRPVLERAVETMRSYATTVDGTVTVRIPRRLPEVRGDADALQDVVHNLTGNALKYSTPPRRVRIEATVDEGHVVVRVRDNGIGIPAGQLSKIFDPFYRVKDERTVQTGGAGLGLAIVKHTIEAHAGTVSVESTVGTGTIVTMRLPVSEDVERK